ncbi:MAG: hypothetical protein ACE5E4_04795 [Candidatus Binatia bacterium]
MPWGSVRSGVAGFALVGVVVFTLMASLVLARTFDALHQAWIFEKADDRVHDAASGNELALGTGISKLLSGIPPSDNFKCILRLRGEDGSKFVDYELSYKKKAGNKWSVKAKPAAGDEEEGGEPDVCPPLFEETCPWGPL